MHTTLRYSLCVLLFFLPALTVHARDITIPAGTLMECTLDEPAFSSATTSVGDPFLCYPRNIQEFGQPVFPRGSYFVGHLEDDRDPGHFVGKGYLKLAIDRIGLPTTDIPVQAKVISVAGYKVDRHGDVIGHGHATRDTVEWMLPPLWPWKVLSLPAKGPRPVLKGEVRVTLRVMDDFIVPQQVAENIQPPRFVAPDRPRLQPDKGWHLFGSPAGIVQRRSSAAPQSIPIAYSDESLANSITGSAARSSVRSLMIPASTKTLSAWPANVTVFALSDGTMIPAREYWRDSDALNYALASGERGSVRLDSIDWSATSRLNWARGIRVTLHNATTQEVRGN
jgi:hypothetical protein